MVDTNIQCSGSIKVDDMQNLPANVRIHQQDNQTYTYSSWVTSPAHWTVKQVLMQYAHWAGVTIKIDTETSGWIFKRNKYFFVVEGTKKRVTAFTTRYSALARANS